jgi:hypothetical protein
VIIERVFEMPSKWTFTQPKTRAWVEERLEGDVLNLFGGFTRFPGAVHNEINPDLSADIRLDACNLELWQDYGGKFDTVIMDPPFSFNQAVVTYGIKKAQQITHARDVILHVLRPRGRVLSCGYNSTGMGETRGFEKEGLLIVNHGGSHNDMMVLCERRR